MLTFQIEITVIGKLPRFAVPICGAILLLFLAGCAHYQLGTGSTEDLAFRSIYVAPVENTAASPQSAARLSREIRRSLAQDGRVTLAANPAQADVILAIELTDRNRSFTSVQPNDTALARKFDLTLTVLATLTEQRTGNVIFENREIEVTRQIFVDGGQNPAEYQVMPQLAAALADRVTHSVLDVW